MAGGVVPQSPSPNCLELENKIIAKSSRPAGRTAAPKRQRRRRRRSPLRPEVRAYAVYVGDARQAVGSSSPTSLIYFA